MHLKLRRYCNFWDEKFPTCVTSARAVKNVLNLNNLAILYRKIRFLKLPKESCISIVNDSIFSFLNSCSKFRRNLI